MSPGRRWSSLLIVFATLAAPSAGAAQPVAIDPPAPPGSTSPALAAEGATTVTEEHEILMTWWTPDGPEGGRLSFSRLSEGAWNEPITIADGVTPLADGDRPSLTVIDTQAVRRTLIARTGDVVARSGDAGRTWSRLPSPPLPSASFAGADEGAYAFWLDGDNGDTSRLLGTRVLAGRTVLDPAVAGAGTAAAMTWDGPIVAYRDRRDDGTLAVSLIRRQDARWTPPRTVHVGDWRPNDVPPHGPAVAALQREVAVAWYAEEGGQATVLVAFSEDAGRSFGPPAAVYGAVSRNVPLAPVDLVLDDDGNAIVLWMVATSPTTARLTLASVSPDGRRGEELVLETGLTRRPGNVPQMTRAGDRLAVAWTEVESGRVRAVALPLSDLSPAGTGDLEAPITTAARPPAASGVETSPETEASPPASVGHGRVGEPAPEAALRSLDGDPVSVADLRGRPVLLNLWATWCLPCIAEMPELTRLVDRYRDRGLELIGVSIDSGDAVDKVRAFIAEHEAPFSTVWLDPGMSLPDALRLRGVPSTLVIDREGRILWRRDEVIEADDPTLAAALETALEPGED